MIKTKEMISQYVKLLKPKEVLDLGCGKGKISLRFAEMGANVTGVDKREEKYIHEKFNFVRQDIKDFKFSKNFDLIITSFVFHFLN
ncbi:MAG: class I SAM-dependent methyltransferase, partial [Nanoarchaeota archaeon]|nr:class I SAM-dependent methyltransferase [Nanoarchaeota archaeon]